MVFDSSRRTAWNWKSALWSREGEEKIALTVDGPSDHFESSTHMPAWKTQSSQRLTSRAKSPAYATIRNIICTLLIAAFGFSLTFHILRKDSSQTRPDSLRSLDIHTGEEINGLIPEFPRKAVQFWSDDTLALDDEEPSTADRIEGIDREWKKLMPPGGGYIHIDNSDKYLLPPGMPAPNDNTSLVWIISVYHQLHCLDGIRSALNQFYLRGERQNSMHDHSEHPQHVYHCVEYLRQTIMCHGDTALEGSLDGLPGTSGWGTTHVCKDYEAVRNFAEEQWRLIKMSSAGD